MRRRFGAPLLWPVTIPFAFLVWLVTGEFTSEPR